MSHALSSPARPASAGPNLEKLALWHTGLMLIFASWVFGGNIGWARTVLAVWGAGGVLITVAALLQTGEHGRDTRRRAWALLPWVLFGVLTLASCLNPSFQPITIEGQPLLVHLGAPHPALPSTVNPALTFATWAFTAGAYLSAFNLWLVVRHRRPLRLLFLTAALNTLVLAVFGTVQKLLGRGYYFGLSTSPNPRYFATFIYYNHWGAFMVLFLAVTTGLLFHSARRILPRARDLWHSPFTAALAATIFIAASAPVSASRSATALAAVVATLATGQALWHIADARRAQGRAAWPPILAVLLLGTATTGAVGWLAHRSITERVADTREALAAHESLLAGRERLYRDTWTLAMQQPAFGWGLESYGTAFMLIRPRSIFLDRQYESSYVKAHSDWLQAVAETGFVGTACLLLMGLVPLAGLRWRMLRHPLVGYPLLGCGLVALYAWVELPFANGAVLIGFWTLFFAALAYARLDRKSGGPTA